MDGQSLLQSYIDAFHTHSDAVCQVARFVAAGCALSNSKLYLYLFKLSVICGVMHN